MALAAAALSHLPRGLADRRAAVALYRSLLLGRASLPARAVVGGARFQLDLSEWPQAQAFLLGRYDPETVRFILDHLRPGGVVLDGGAHVGLVGLQVAANRPDAVVHEFEPHPASYAALHRNAGLNPGNVRLVEAGLSDQTGEIPFDMAGHSIQPKADRSIPVTTIDTYLSEHGIDRVDVLKLDIEGHEIAALRGAAIGLREGRIRAVTIETLSGENRQADELLAGAGFRRVELADLRPGWIRRCRPYGARENAGYVFQPR